MHFLFHQFRFWLGQVHSVPTPPLFVNLADAAKHLPATLAFVCRLMLLVDVSSFQSIQLVKATFAEPKFDC